VPPDEARRALGQRKEQRPHPASPDAAERASRAAGSYRLDPHETAVMFCVRVPASLRQRVKLAALQSGRAMQELVAEALDAECRRQNV
jgi:predicted HicB family RNase H-like nuclease